MNTTGDTTMQDDSDEQQEVIEVQILPQVRLDFDKQSFKKSPYPKELLKCHESISRNLKKKCEKLI